MTHRFEDRATVSSPKRTADGYLVATAFVARKGVQLYAGREIGLADRDTVLVYRPEDEVTRPESVRGYSHAPVTLGHPNVMVTADNWRQFGVGEVSTEAEWKDGKLALPLILKDAAAIKAVEDGTARELSAGYTCELELVDGVSPEGEKYNAIQRNITINHLALVPRGRAGSECRIGDSSWGGAPINLGDSEEGRMPGDNLKLVVLGDTLGVNLPLADAQVVERWRDEQRQAIKDAAAAADKVIAAKDADIAKLEAERDQLKAQVLSDADIDKRVAERTALVDRALKVAPGLATAGLTPAQIKRAAVEANVSDKASLADKSDAYIEARFDLLQEQGGSQRRDPVLGSVRDAAPVGSTHPKKAEVADAISARNADLRDAWKNASSGAEPQH